MAALDQQAAQPGEPAGSESDRRTSAVGDAAVPPGLPTRHGRSRDRRGRGLRGPLLAPGLPAARSRSQVFDDHVRAGIARLSRRWGRQLNSIEIVVEDVPASAGAPWEDGVVLGRAFPPAHGLPARIVLYRRPIEARVPAGDLGVCVLDVLVEELAHLLNRNPNEIDPGYGRP